MPKSVNLILPDCDYDLKCDKMKLEIVFVNLLSNALDAIHHEGNIKIQMKKIDNFLEIEFEDSGSGIEHDKLEQIFEPLFTLKQKGTGLGLASCKSIVEQHNGTITARNNPTVFSVKLSTNL
jgi:signal transduction histidine kinase